MVRNNAMTLDVPYGVITGDDLTRLYEHAQYHEYAIPAFHVASWDACRIVLDAARENRSPVTLRLTFGACLPLRRPQHTSSTTDLAVSEAITLATAIHVLALQYQVPVVLETEMRCLNKLSTWFEPLMERIMYANDDEETSTLPPLFSSHFLELADVQNLEECLDIAEQYLLRLSERQVWLHVKLPSSIVVVATSSLSATKKNPWLYAQERLQRHSPRFSLIIDQDSFYLLSKSESLPKSSFLLIDEEDSNCAAAGQQERSTASPVLAEHLAMSLDRSRWQGAIQVQITRPMPINIDDLNETEPEQGKNVRLLLPCNSTSATIRRWAQRQQDHFRDICQTAMEQCRSQNRLQTCCNHGMMDKNLTGVQPVWNFLYSSNTVLNKTKRHSLLGRVAVTSSLLVATFFLWRNNQTPPLLSL